MRMDMYVINWNVVEYNERPPDTISLVITIL